MADSSFDIVSKVDPMEVDNAVNQAQREIAQRFDFKNVDASIEKSGDTINLEANSEERVKAVLDVLQSKWIKRGMSLKQLEHAEPFLSGKVTKIKCTVKEGISQEQAKKVGKLIRDEGPKTVKVQIQGDELRVTLANYELNCDAYAPTPDNGAFVVLTFLLPVGQHPVVGSYPWSGLPRGEKSADSNFDLKSPVVMPVIRLGKKSLAMLPGGLVDIQRLNLERQGEVAGVMRLEQSGGDGQPPTRLFGSFTARVCRTTVPAGS